MHDCSFMTEPRFAAAYEDARETGSWCGPWGQASIHWRAHTLCWAGQTACNLDGDFVECGVDHGGTAMLLHRYLRLDLQPQRQFYLYDTFCGLDRNRSSDSEWNHYDGIYHECYDEVRKRFEGFSNVQLKRGSIPDTLDDTAPVKVAFMHIDMNAAEPELSAISFFWPRLVLGAIVVLDDYAWVACHKQKLAMDQFARDHDVSILSMPTGQGLLIKKMD
jgi:hypothetical protein